MIKTGWFMEWENEVRYRAPMRAHMSTMGKAMVGHCASPRAVRPTPYTLSITSKSRSSPGRGSFPISAPSAEGSSNSISSTAECPSPSRRKRHQTHSSRRDDEIPDPRAIIDRVLCRIRGHKYPDDWTHHNPNQDPIWWASKTCLRCRTKKIWYRMVIW
jgi:hypothetical protein